MCDSNDIRCKIGEYGDMAARLSGSLDVSRMLKEEVEKLISTGKLDSIQATNLVTIADKMIASSTSVHLLCMVRCRDLIEEFLKGQQQELKDLQSGDKPFTII